MPRDTSSSMLPRKWQGMFNAASFYGRPYRIYVPHDYRPRTPLPLLVMLHGCSQSAGDFAVSTEMNALADTYGCLVVYPEQLSAANSRRCWNWFRAEHQERGNGEPAEIVGIVQEVKAHYRVDPNRVYVAGLSAGAAMAVILGATYPDVFAAIGVCSGVPYKASTHLPGSLLVMARGVPDVTRHGHAAYVAMGDYRRVMPVMVFHGTHDHIVHPRNGDQVLDQWYYTNNLVQQHVRQSQPVQLVPEITTGQVPGGLPYSAHLYRDSGGNVLMGKYMVEGMQHCWPGGASDGSYTDPRGPRASQMLIDFFLTHTLEPTITFSRLPRQQPAPGAGSPRVQPGVLQRIGNRLNRLLRR